MPCQKDADCGVPSLVCINKSYCSVPTNANKACKSDADCGGKYFEGHDKCDVKSGFCYCNDDKKCHEANKASGGTYKCSTY